MEVNECNPSLSTKGCQCTDYHNIDTCRCSTGYRNKQGSTSLCTKAAAVGVMWRLNFLWNDDFESDTDERAAFEAEIYPKVIEI